MNRVIALDRLFAWRLGIAAVFVVLVFVVWQSLHHTLRDELESERIAARRELELIASFLASALQDGRYQDAEQLLQHWGENDPDVVQLELVAPNGFSIARYRRTTHSDHTLALELPINYSYRRGPVLHLLDDLTPVYRRHYRLLAGLGVVFVILGTLVSFLAVTLFQRQRAVTDLRLRSEALTRNEERLRLALKAGRMGIFDWDIRGDNIIWSEEHARLFGLQPGEFDGRYETFARHVHPDDLARVNRVVDDARHGRRAYAQSFRIIWPDGSLHWVEAQGEFVLDADRQPLRMTGVITNIDKRKQTEQLLTGEKEVLEKIAAGAPLALTLDTLMRNTEAVAPDSRCSVLLLDSDGVHLRHGAAPSLPAEYLRAIDGSAIGPNAGSCGTAVFFKREVIVSNIAEDPLWHDYRALALPHNLHACWSTPIRTGTGDVVGSFAMYFQTPRRQTEDDRSLIERVTHLCGIAVGRARAEGALRESEQRFRATFEQAAVGMAITSGAGQWVDVNDRLCAILGYNRMELLRRSFQSITHPDDLPASLDALQRLLRNEQDHYAAEKRYIRADGTHVWAHLTVNAVHDGGDKPKYFLSAIQDISARKEAEFALQNLMYDLEQRVRDRTAELAETNAELEAFTYTVSHDLRAPLRAVQGLAQALQEDYADVLDDPGRDYATRLVRAAERMDALIQDLLAYSRLTRMALQPERVDLNAVLERVREQLAADISASNAIIKIKRPLPVVSAHTTTLAQVVANLLANAIKFVEPGERPRVRIWAEPHNGHARLWIEDNGIGIDAEHRERVFRVFERLHGIETYPGTGIGLAIVHKAMERMGGAVGIESAPVKGSCFWIELPLSRS